MKHASVQTVRLGVDGIQDGVVMLADGEYRAVLEVGGEGGAEGVGVDGPAGGVLGVAVAVLFEEAVEELEELAGGPEVAEGVLEGVVADRVVDHLAEPGGVGGAVLGGGRERMYQPQRESTEKQFFRE